MTWVKVVLVFLFAWSVAIHKANAGEFPAKGRIFIGSNSADPTQLNQEMQYQNFNAFKTITKYGVDITYSLAAMVDIGFRYEKIYQTNVEINPTPNQNFAANISQDAVFGVLRIPFFRSEYLRLDAFGGFGGANTTFTIKNATQDGQLVRVASGGWLATPCTIAGASVGVGYKNFFFYVEGGVETNKVDSFQRVNNINGNVQTIELSGNYFLIGLLFDGITATSK